MDKKALGQFFTTNYAYILDRMRIPRGVINIVEPFTGKGDLLNFLPKTGYRIEKYDIEPQDDETIRRDTILNPPVYKNKFILTNPPYLARNKSSYKKAYDKYGVNDLYKCFISELLTNQAQGGIIIIPLNFWSSIRVSDVSLRKKFLQIYTVHRVNIFEEKVFDDTVCSFLFTKREILLKSLSDSLSILEKRL